jgi:hypothetical protein
VLYGWLRKRWRGRGGGIETFFLIKIMKAMKLQELIILFADTFGWTKHEGERFLWRKSYYRYKPTRLMITI